MHYYDMLSLALSGVNLSHLRIFNNSCVNLCKDISLRYFYLQVQSCNLLLASRNFEFSFGKLGC